MFDHCHTLEELKVEYRRLAFEYHPDKEVMQMSLLIFNRPCTSD